MNKIRIIHIRSIYQAEEYGYTVFRIDRKTAVGNPFFMKNESERNRVCNMYKTYFKGCIDLYNHDHVVTPLIAQLETIKKAHQQGDIALACWCAPKRCHGETIKAWLEGTL